MKIIIKEKQQGITIIALVITIIVLLILAGISIAMLTGDNGILTQANNAKTRTEIADEKETVELAATSAMVKEPYGEITEAKLDEELNNRPGEGKYSTDPVDEGIAVTFLESGRIYLVETTGKVSEYKSKLPEPTPEDSSIVSFTMTYGVIEVEFLSGTGYTVTATPNTPILKGGMEGVYWTDSTGVINTSNPQSNTVEVKQASESYNAENWYAYTAQTGANDGKTSRWANATTSDGSYYVWIPRYAYRIIYFKDQASEDAYRSGTLSEEDALSSGAIVGYSDARGIVDKEGKRPTSVTSTTSISVNKKYFRTHPVFDGKPEEGGWDSKLEGIWVMKYEASKPNASTTSTGSGTIPMSVSNVKVWEGIKVSDMFTYAKNVYNNEETQNTILNSHMMKNSEWGAVAYLAESKYGRNGTEISVNQCSSKITGTGRGLNSTEDSELTGTSSICNSKYAYTAITEEQKYTGTVGQLSSTSGNIYGIYDLSGGTEEYVMGFYQDKNENIRVGTTSIDSGFNGYISSTVKKEDGINFPTEKKYYQAYKNPELVSSNVDGSMQGDAIKESTNWNKDAVEFVKSNLMVFARGGFYDASDSCGIFNFRNGTGGGSYSFRVCLAVQ